MAGYTLDVPEELYEALQKMAPYATYTYTDDDGGWDLLSPAGRSALTEDRVLDADLLNLYFEVLPQVATLFAKQHPRALNTFSAVPTPSAIKMPKAQLTPSSRWKKNAPKRKPTGRPLKRSSMRACPRKNATTG